MRAEEIVLLLCLEACCAPVHVKSSVFPTAPSLPPSTAPVRISATRDPPDARELGVAEAHGSMHLVTLAAVISEFRSRVASMGGDYGRIDSLATKDEMVLEEYTYECGGYETQYETQPVTRVNPDGSTTSTTETVPVMKYVSKTCTDVREVEVVTLSVVGRAFQTIGEKP